MTTCDRGYEALIDSMLLEALPPKKWNKLRVHLRDCAPCRDRYDRLALAERMLHGGPGAIGRPSPAALDRIGQAVLDGERPRGLAAVPRWAFGVFAVAVSAAMLPLVLRAQLQPAGHAEFAVRGAAGDPGGQAGLRAFCLRARDGASAEVRALEPGGRCGTDDLLKLTYSNRAGYEDLFLVGLDAGWNLKWYEPRPPSAISVPAARAVDQPIGGAIRVGVNHDPGPLRIFALFAHAPIAAREVEGAVEELKRRRASLAEVQALPLGDRDDVVQRTLLVEVTRSH